MSKAFKKYHPLEQKMPGPRQDAQPTQVLPQGRELGPSSLLTGTERELLSASQVSN